MSETEFLDSGISESNKPIESHRVSKSVVGTRGPVRPLYTLLLTGGIVLILFGIALAWYVTPLKHLLTPEKIRITFSWLRDAENSVGIAFGIMVAAETLLVPLTIVVVGALTILGPLLGLPLVMASILCSACLGFGMGRLAGIKFLRQLLPDKVNAASRAVAKKGILAGTVVRLFPVAPFGIINMVAGASHIRFRDFIIGALLGHLPGIVGLTLVVHVFQMSLEDPRAHTLLLTSTIVMVVLLALYKTASHMRQRLINSSDKK
ncbi:MAG: TVP38/TMEM64 family protein [Deltaproteobacteria bacterium]|nr:TVP38/TMEM64 family protein [Deltaproteobacteria bacterium]